MFYDSTTDQLIEEDLKFSPFDFAKWFLSTHDENFFLTLNSKKDYYIGIIPLFSLEKFMLTSYHDNLSRYNELYNSIDYYDKEIHFKNEYVDIKFKIIFYDETLLEIIFVKDDICFKITLTPYLIFQLMDFNEFKFENIKMLE